MTKEDAIDIIKSECYVFNPLNFDRSTMVNTALDMAVKTLEQEPVIDKIRAEIEQDAFKDVNGSKYIFVNRVNQIIDKYKVESEVRE